MKSKKKFITILIISCFIFMSISDTGIRNSQGYIADLVFKTNGGGVRPDYGAYISSYLEDLDINVTLVIEEWSVFVGTLLFTYDFDLAYVGLSDTSTDPDLSSVFSESGSLNAAGIETSIPYCQLNEDMLEQGTSIMNLSERQTHYYQWQQLIMDRIIPILPFYCSRSYTSLWANLDGYDMSWGIIDSLPYMVFNGLHEGQVSTDEFIVRDFMWSEFNPLFLDDSASSFISSLTLEPLLQLTPGGERISTGLITNWEQDNINPNLFNFTLRDNVYWNPSFNVTERTSSSGSLLTETSPDVWEVTDPGELMQGLKTGDASNGTNHKVTATDAVFTLVSWGNSVVSEDPAKYEWIHNIYVDPVDPLTFWIEIDKDPDTPELEFFAPFWESFNVEILPEFFLNSTDPTITYTEGNVKTWGLYSAIINTPQWQAYSESVFGCGKYMLDYYIKHSQTTLTTSPFWMGVGAVDGTTQNLDISNVIVRVIPDDNAALVEFEAGKLDLFGTTIFPSNRSAHQADPRFEVQSMLGGTLDYMFINLRRPFIGDANNYIYLTDPGKETYTKGCAIRKAMCYAIDREEMNTVINGGEKVISDSVIHPAKSFWYYNDIVKYSRNLTLAQEWLDAAYNIVIPEFKEFMPLALSIIVVAVWSYRKRRT